VEGGGNSEPVEVSKTPVKVKGSFAVRVGAPVPVPSVIVSVIADVPLKTPLSVNVASVASADGAKAADSPIASAAVASPRDKFSFIIMGNFPSNISAIFQAIVPDEAPSGKTAYAGAGALCNSGFKQIRRTAADTVERGCDKGLALSKSDAPTNPRGRTNA
jgi:hypothetical protein